MKGMAMSQESLKAALEACINGLKQNPKSAQVVLTAHTELDEDVRTTAKVRDFPPMVVDEPPVFGGTDKGMNPGEVLLVALGTCQEIMYSAFASVMGIQLDELKITCEGALDLHGMFALDEAVPAGFTRISFETHIKSPESADRIRELIDMAQSHCPLLDTITRAVPASGSAYLNGALISDLDARDAAE